MTISKGRRSQVGMLRCAILLGFSSFILLSFIGIGSSAAIKNISATAPAGVEPAGRGPGMGRSLGTSQLRVSVSKSGFFLEVYSVVDAAQVAAAHATSKSSGLFVSEASHDVNCQTRSVCFVPH